MYRRSYIKSGITIVVFFLQSFNLAAQKIEISFPGLINNRGSLYYFQGSRTDSIPFMLNQEGKATINLPEAYKGMIRIDMRENGQCEFIAGEPLLQLKSNQSILMGVNVETASDENRFLYKTFIEKADNARRINWLQQGIELYQDYQINSKLKEELFNQQKRIAAISKAIDESPFLYASRFLKIAGFADRLVRVLESGNLEDSKELNDYLKTEIDWPTLYTSNYWDLIINCYIEFVVRQNKSQNEIDSQLIGVFAETLSIQEKAVSSSLFETLYRIYEMYGMDSAKEKLLSFVVDNDIEIQSDNDFLQRILSSQSVETGKKALALEGMKDGTKYPLLIVFYESGCGNCDIQTQELISYYPKLQQKGLTVVSVSADMDKEVYKSYVDKFPWQEKLCDYKGFDGNNFLKYGIVGVPIMYLTDKNGIIIGEYSKLTDLLKDISDKI